MTRIAVVGGGKIGEALIAGLLKAGWAPRDLLVAERAAARAQELSRKHGIVSVSVRDAAETADVVVVAVKPGDVDAVLGVLGETALAVDREQMVVSLAAGLPTAWFEARLPAGYPVVRVMSNTPMLVGSGMSVVSAGRHAKAGHVEAVVGMLGSVGRVAVLPESQMDVVTAVSGSGPAYVFLVAEALVDAAVAQGLPREVASELVIQTVAGAGDLLAASGLAAPGASGVSLPTAVATELRAAVTSPGGTTAAAIAVLERNALRSAFFDAVGAAKARSAELGRLNA